MREEFKMVLTFIIITPFITYAWVKLAVWVSKKKEKDKNGQT